MKMVGLSVFVKKKSLIIGFFCVLSAFWIGFPFFFPPQFLPSTKIYDRHGTLLYEVLSPRAISQYEVPYDQIPPTMIDALTASEDKNFFSHTGNDPLAITRALLANVQHGRVVSGASTITNQTVKVMLFPEHERTVLQKVREAILSPLYELTHSKQNILQQYLNRAYFAHNNYGVGSASRYYFDKDPVRLSLPEVALLVGLLPAPEYYDPIDHFDRAKERQKEVLNAMVENGKISEKESLEAQQVQLTIGDGRRGIKAPHAVMEVLKEVQKKYPQIMEGGYEITTTIDLPWQEDAEKIVAKGIEKVRTKHVSNGALVAIDPRDGAIRVVVGSRDYFGPEGQVNVAYAKRQPGSSLKPFTYLAYFYYNHKGTGSIIYDIERAFETKNGVYRPKNYDQTYHGPISVREALGNSFNIPAVVATDEVGFVHWYDTLRRFGLRFDHDPEYYGLGITLGGGEVRLVDLTHAYSMLANGGKKTSSYLIDHIAFMGDERFQVQKPENETLFPEDSARGMAAISMVNHVLRDDGARALSFSLRSLLYINDRVAVKTGTTMDFHDNWAVGYTPDLTVGVWVGNNDNTPMEGVSGITGSVPIWHNFMRLREEQTRSMQELPTNVVALAVCRLSGQKATKQCPDQRKELYIQGDEPTEEDTWYQSQMLDSKTNLLWKPGCIGKPIMNMTYNFPSEVQTWAMGSALPLRVHTYCDGTTDGERTSSWSVAEPKEGEVYRFSKERPLSSYKIPLKVVGQGILDEKVFINTHEQTFSKTLPVIYFLPVQIGINTLKIGSSSVTFTVEQQ